jgi:hypothetical protein
MAKNTVIIPSKITKGEELVIIPRSLYEKFFRWKKEKKIVDRIIAQGEKELKERKTIIAKSSKEALRIFHGKKNK